MAISPTKQRKGWEETLELIELLMAADGSDGRRQAVVTPLIARRPICDRTSSEDVPPYINMRIISVSIYIYICIYVFIYIQIDKCTILGLCWRKSMLDVTAIFTRTPIAILWRLPLWRCVVCFNSDEDCRQMADEFSPFFRFLFLICVRCALSKHCLVFPGACVCVCVCGKRQYINIRKLMNSIKNSSSILQ